MLARHALPSHDREVSQDGIRTPRIRVAAIIVRGNEILLVRHMKGGRSYWLLPGGGIDFGESLTEGLVRELSEEACVTIEVDDLVIVNDSIAPDSARHTLNLCFTAHITHGEPSCGGDPRVVEVRFVPIDELKSLTLHPDIRYELVSALRAGFPKKALYLGNLWTD